MFWRSSKLIITSLTTHILNSKSSDLRTRNFWGVNPGIFCRYILWSETMGGITKMEGLSAMGYPEQAVKISHFAQYFWPLFVLLFLCKRVNLRRKDLLPQNKKKFDLSCFLEGRVLLFDTVIYPPPLFWENYLLKFSLVPVHPTKSFRRNFLKS